MNKKNSKVITKRFFSTVLSVLMAFSLYSGIPGAKSEAASLSNPTKTSLGVATWDCVYFGSYPQTEIVSEGDSAQIAALEKMNTYYKTEYEKVSASQWEAITGASYDANGDAIVNGVKYHRITKEDATSSRTTSNYYNWTDSTSYHYFRYDRIKWKVLSINGTDALLLAERGLDTQRYNGDYSDVTWKNSTIRSWLNGYGSSYNTYGNDYRGNSFFDRAFSSTEKNLIVTSNVANKDNPIYGTSGGNNTADKIFLLSIDEILNADFEFSTSETARDNARRMKSSTYAKAMGAYSSSSGNKPTADTGNCNWLLRSPGKSSNFSAYIKDLGTIDEGGNSAYSHDSKAICPALHLNISSSDAWSYAGTISSDGSSTEVDDPKTEEKTTEEKTTEEKSTEKKTTEEISTEKKTTEEISTEKKTTEEISTEKKTTEEISTEKKTTEEISTEKKTTEEISTEKKTTEKKTTEEISTEKKTTEEKDPETQVTEKDTHGNTSTETVYDQKDTVIAVKSIKLTGISKKIAAGRKITLTPVFTPSNCSNKNLIWKSSNTNYATVSDTGVVYTKKKGAGKTVTITAVSADGKGVQGVYKIKIVKHAVKKIKLKAQSTSVTAGKNLTVKANVKTTGKTANKTLVWSSSNRSYATVTNKGVVKTKKAGKGKKVTITAKATDGTGKKAKIKIKIK